jgi:hypothetical protein
MHRHRHGCSRLRLMIVCGLASLLTSAAYAQAGKDKDKDDRDKDDHRKHHSPVIMWIDPLDFLAGDPSVNTSFNAVNSGVGSGLSGLIIQSTTTGDTATGGGNKVVEKGLQVPPGYLIKGVRLCYELSNARSFFTQIRLAQVQDPPSSAIVRLDDPTHQTNPGPVCVNSQPTSVDPSEGGVLLDLRVNFGNTSDRIVLRAVGLHLAHKP